MTKILQKEVDFYKDFIGNIKSHDIFHMLQEIIILGHFDTHIHLRNTANYVQLIALELGFTVPQANVLSCCSAMHDIAKVMLPMQILNKATELTVNEFEVVKTHTTLGHNILAKNSQDKGCFLASEVALSHHERWSGHGGYPNGLKGRDIPLPARITAIADVFEALTDHRRYKKTWSKEEAINYIRVNKNDQFDPELVKVFLSIRDEIMVYVDTGSACGIDWTRGE